MDGDLWLNKLAAFCPIPGRLLMPRMGVGLFCINDGICLTAYWADVIGCVDVNILDWLLKRPGFCWLFPKSPPFIGLYGWLNEGVLVL